MKRTRLFFSLGVTALLAGAAVQLSSQEASMPDLARLQAMTARFAPVEITADISSLPAGEQKALAKMVEAGRIMDTLFLRQVWSGNENMLSQLQKDNSPLGKARLHYFLINKGPWSRLDNNAPFIPGAPNKPEGANFYPAGAAKAEVEAWLKALSEAERARATGFFTVIRRPAGGKPGFAVVPYSVEYQKDLAQAAGLLREAAALTAQPTLKAYLTSRADAFVSNEYYASDVAWMELDAGIEPTIGPYEVYEDEWFNYKAAFEAFITIRDEAETAKLAKLGAQLQDIEDHLPIDPKYRNPKLGGLAPIRVVNEILASGDGNRGVQTAAFNLPNDERMIREKGAKRVMLRNVQQAKFQIALMPISRNVLSAADQKNVSFDPFFTHTVMHELMHGLGPHEIHAGGRTTTVRQELKDTYSTIEEAKADISGLFALQYLVDKGVLGKGLGLTMYDTFLASAFRAIRFGLAEAHGKGIAIQLNYLLDYGAFRTAPDGTFAVDPARIKEGVIALTRELMTLEAEGNYAKARDLLKKLVVVRPEVKRALDRLQNVPVDIEPKFITAERLFTGVKKN
ncbi:MAG: hypothetical protein LAP85_03140 [Acidobacteriia bacterium]|nr:hypothetical protein [Terriglobia bacterium]